MELRLPSGPRHCFAAAQSEKLPWLVPIAALARWFFDYSAPTRAWAVSHLFRLWLLTHWAIARSFGMGSAITGELVCNASSYEILSGIGPRVERVCV